MKFNAQDNKREKRDCKRFKSFYLYVRLQLVTNHDTICRLNAQIITSRIKYSRIGLFERQIRGHENAIKKRTFTHVESQFVNLLPLCIGRTIGDDGQQVILPQLLQHLNKLFRKLQVVVTILQPLLVNVIGQVSVLFGQSFLPQVRSPLIERHRGVVGTFAESFQVICRAEISFIHSHSMAFMKQLG